MVQQLQKRHVMLNKQYHVAATRASPGYDGDIVCEHKGNLYSTLVSSVTFDGTGYTRSYKNQPRGSQAASILVGSTAKSPLYV